jgi:hypothetical protein
MSAEYNPQYTLTKEAEGHPCPTQASKNLPPSRPLEHSDRPGHTNQTTTINIGRHSDRDEEAANISSGSTKPSEPDACDKAFGSLMCMIFLGMFITMVATAVFLQDGATALKENTRVLSKMMQTTTKTVTQTVTRWGSQSPSAVTVAEENHKIMGTMTEEDAQSIADTVSRIVANLPTGNA